MLDVVPDHQRGHSRETYSTPPCTWTEQRRSLSRNPVLVAELGWVSEEGGNSLYEAQLSDCALRQIHLDDIKTRDTPDIGGAWVLIQ